MTDATVSDLAQGTERADWLNVLQTHRDFLRYTVRDLTDEQARLAPTASVLTLGGLIKHVASSERNWVNFILEGKSAMPEIDPGLDWADVPAEVVAAFEAEFAMTEAETLADLLDEYQRVADRTAEVIQTADLNLSQELPTAPWHEPGAQWTTRRVLGLILAETAQHAGHADIIRETIDGQKTMAMG